MALDSAPCDEVFGLLSEGFDRACASANAVPAQAEMSFAGRRVRLRCAGPRCLSNITPAFEHLRGRVPTGDSIALAVDVWCEREAPSGMAELACLDEAAWCRGSPDGRFVGIARPDYTAVIDRVERRIVARAPDANAFPNFQRAKPFLYVLAVWYNDRRLFTLHGGLVAHRGRAALIAGQGGAGKSTVCMACLEGGLSFLGDDHVAVEPSAGQHCGHSMFASLQLADDQVDRFPRIAAHRRAGRTIEYGRSESGEPLRVREKSVVQVACSLPGQTSASAPIGAVIVPRFDPNGRETRVEAVSGAEAFRAIVPGTLENLYSSYKRLLPQVSEMLHRVPCYRLHTTPDVGAIPAAVRGLLEEHGCE